MSHVHRQDSSRERAPWSRRPSVASTTTAVSSSSEYSSALPLPFCADDESEEKAPTSTSTSPSSIVPPPPDHHHHHHFPARRQDDLEVGSSCSSSSNGSSSSDYHRCSMASSCHVVARDLPYVSHTTSLLPSTPNRTHPATPLPQDPLLAQSSQLQQQQWEGGAGGAAAVVMISSLPNSSLLSLPSRPYLMGLGNDHKPFNGSHKAKQSPEKEEKEEDGEKESTNLVATVGNDGPTPVRNEGGGSSSPSSSTSLAVATLRGASRRRSVSIAESAGRGTTTTVPPVPVQSLTLAELDIMSRAALIDHIVALQGCHQNGATCPQPPPPPPVATPCNGIVLPSQLQSQDPSTLPVLIVQQEEEQQPQQQQKQRITLFQPQKQIGLEFDASLTTPTPIPLQSQSQLEGMEAALMDKSTSPATTPPSPASGRGLRLPPTLTMHEFAEKSLLTDFAANLNLTPVASAAWLQPVTTTEHVQKAVDDDGSKLINDYVVLQELGRGAFGKVKLAYDPHHCRMVAIKIVRKPSGAKALRGNQQDEIATLQREIAVMKKLRHKNIVNLYEVIDDPEANKLYLVMRYVDNGPIGKVETDLSSTRYPPEELLPLATNVINGLYYLHARNIVHRDIKPENILVSSDGEAFLADFGVSEMFEREDAMSVEGKRGTKLFMAPELLNSTGNAVKGRALDIWALGVTLFALLTGRMPFASIDEITDPTLPHYDNIPEQWQTLLKGMLQRDAEKRLSVFRIKRMLKELQKCLRISKQCGGKDSMRNADLLLSDDFEFSPDVGMSNTVGEEEGEEGQQPRGLIEVIVSDTDVETAFAPKSVVTYPTTEQTEWTDSGRSFSAHPRHPHGSSAALLGRQTSTKRLHNAEVAEGLYTRHVVVPKAGDSCVVVHVGHGGLEQQAAPPSLVPHEIVVFHDDDDDVEKNCNKRNTVVADDCLLTPAKPQQTAAWMSLPSLNGLATLPASEGDGLASGDCNEQMRRDEECRRSTLLLKTRTFRSPDDDRRNDEDWEEEQEDWKEAAVDRNRRSVVPQEFAEEDDDGACQAHPQQQQVAAPFDALGNSGFIIVPPPPPPPTEDKAKEPTNTHHHPDTSIMGTGSRKVVSPKTAKENRSNEEDGEGEGTERLVPLPPLYAAGAVGASSGTRVDRIRPTSGDQHSSRGRTVAELLLLSVSTRRPSLISSSSSSSHAAAAALLGGVHRADEDHHHHAWGESCNSDRHHRSSASGRTMPWWGGSQSGSHRSSSSSYHPPPVAPVDEESETHVSPQNHTTVDEARAAAETALDNKATRAAAGPVAIMTASAASLPPLPPSSPPSSFFHRSPKALYCSALIGSAPQLQQQEEILTARREREQREDPPGRETATVAVSQPSAAVAVGIPTSATTALSTAMLIAEQQRQQQQQQQQGMLQSFLSANSILSTNNISSSSSTALLLPGSVFQQARYQQQQPPQRGGGVLPMSLSPTNIQSMEHSQRSASSALGGRCSQNNLPAALGEQQQQQQQQQRDGEGGDEGGASSFLTQSLNDHHPHDHQDHHLFTTEGTTTVHSFSSPSSPSPSAVNRVETAKLCLTPAKPNVGGTLPSPSSARRVRTEIFLFS